MFYCTNRERKHACNTTATWSPSFRIRMLTRNTTALLLIVIQALVVTLGLGDAGDLGASILAPHNDYAPPMLTMFVTSGIHDEGTNNTTLVLTWEGENLAVEDDDAREDIRRQVVARCEGSTGRHVLVLLNNAVVKAFPINATADGHVSCHSDRDDCQPYGRCCGGSIPVAVRIDFEFHLGTGQTEQHVELQLLLSDSACRRGAVMHRGRLIREVASYAVRADRGWAFTLIEPSPPPTLPFEDQPHTARADRERDKDFPHDVGEMQSPACAISRHQPRRPPRTRGDYSTHICSGAEVGQEGAAEALQDGTCLFENVCMLDGELTYTAHPNASVGAPTNSNFSAARIPRIHALSRLWSASPREPCPVWEEVEWRVRRGCIGNTYPRTRIPHVYIRRLYQENAGHVLGDDAWAIFQVIRVV